MVRFANNAKTQKVCDFFFFLLLLRHHSKFTNLWISLLMYCIQKGRGQTKFSPTDRAGGSKSVIIQTKNQSPPQGYMNGPFTIMYLLLYFIPRGNLNLPTMHFFITLMYYTNKTESLLFTEKMLFNEQNTAHSCK